MRRRTFLGASALSLTATGAGCTELRKATNKPKVVGEEFIELERESFRVLSYDFTGKQGEFMFELTALFGSADILIRTSEQEDPDVTFVNGGRVRKNFQMNTRRTEKGGFHVSDVYVKFRIIAGDEGFDASLKVRLY
jgi:hypothetical protein